jgi:hypothetical protein
MSGDFKILIVAVSAIWMPAFAGSVGGSAAAPQASGSTDCDRRTRFINCTETAKNHILDKCHVVIHRDKRTDCTWQSCGYMSVVQKSPSAVGRNLLEYGMTTSIDAFVGGSQNPPPASWGCASGSCKPKSPYPRHYYTVREALALRSKSDGSEDATKIAEIPEQVLKSNPYLECATRPPVPAAELVYVFLSRKTDLLNNQTAIGIMVPKTEVAKACSSLQLFDKNGACNVGTNSVFPEKSVPLANYLSGKPTCDTLTETQTRYKTVFAPRGGKCESEVQTRTKNCMLVNGVKNYDSFWSDWSPRNYIFSSCN